MAVERNSAGKWDPSARPAAAGGSPDAPHDTPPDLPSDPPPHKTESTLRWPGAAPASDGIEPGLDDRDPLVGAMAGEWKLVKYIGGGAMGRVYRAEHDGYHKAMAVKALAPRAGDFEGRLHEALDHPNIVRADGFGVLTDADGRRRPYILMELLGPTATLDQWSRERPRTLDERLSVFAGALRGVAHAHSLGVLHHDLKPGNILVDRHGAAKVADFGLAQLRIESGGALVGGTRAYESPEQCALSAEALDARSDVYALGVTLFELLTGQLPLPAAGSREEAYRIKRERPPRLDLLPLETPRRLRALLRQSLDPVPERRFKDAGAMAEALERVRGRGALERTADSALAAAHRRPRAAAMLCAVIVALVLAAVLTGPLRRVTPYEGWFLSRLPPLDAATGGAFKDVRIVRMPGPAEMAELAAELGVEGVRPAPAQSWRPLHGAFIEAMAEAGARVIALDLYFRQMHDQYDEPLARAIKASVDRGVPVVIGTNSWIADAEGHGEAPGQFWRAGANWGALSVDMAGRLPLPPLAAAPHGEQAVPGFSLAVFAAATDPQSRMVAQIEGRRVRARFWRPTRDPGGRRMTGGAVFVSAAVVQSASELPDRDRHGREPHWTVAYAQRASSTIADLDAATLNYANLLRASPAQRAADVGKRVLVVVNPEEDWKFDLRLERPLLGGEVQAGAIERLLAGRTARLAPEWTVLLLSLPAAAVGATIGGVIPLRVPTSPRRRVVALAATSLALAALAVCADGALAGIYRWRGVIVLPVAPMVALLASAVAATALVRTFSSAGGASGGPASAALPQAAWPRVEQG